jgi:hypothetical protein
MAYAPEVLFYRDPLTVHYFSVRICGGDSSFSSQKFTRPNGAPHERIPGIEFLLRYKGGSTRLKVKGENGLIEHWTTNYFKRYKPWLCLNTKVELRQINSRARSANFWLEAASRRML